MRFHSSHRRCSKTVLYFEMFCRILNSWDKFGNLYSRPWGPLKKWPSHDTHGGFAPEQTKLEKLCKNGWFCQCRQLQDRGRIRQTITFCGNCFRARTWSVFSAWPWFTTAHLDIWKNGNLLCTAITLGSSIISDPLVLGILNDYFVGLNDILSVPTPSMLPSTCWSHVSRPNSIWCDRWLSIDISPAISLRADYCKNQEQQPYIFWSQTSALPAQKISFLVQCNALEKRQGRRV